MRDLSGGLEHLSLNWATVREQWDLRQAIEGCARHGIPGIAPWREPLQALGVAEAARLIADHGLAVSGLCRGGMFPAPDEAGRRAAIDDNRRAIDEAAAIGARCLVLVAGGLPPGSKDLAGARAQVRDGLAALLPHAQGAGVALAVEPLHPMYAADRCCVSTLGQALDLCAELDPAGAGGVTGLPPEGGAAPVGGAPGAAIRAAPASSEPGGPPPGRPLGVAIDVYHVWWDPDLAAQVARAGAEGRILAFHVCDWLVPTRDLLLDRGMMGDGVIDIPAIRAMVEATGYDGPIEVEIFSKDDWWRRDPDEVLRITAERYRSVV